MLSTAISRCFAFIAILLVWPPPVAWAKSDLPPRILQEPVLGLRYLAAKGKFDPLPEDVPPKCTEYSGTEAWKVGRLWIFAAAQDAGRTYYVVGGYSERRRPKPAESRYELDQFGGVISIHGMGFKGYGQAREVFDARYFEEIPQPILQQLADDFAARLTRAVGGQGRLRRELRNQHIDLESLPVELEEAFKPFFSHQ